MDGTQYISETLQKQSLAWPLHPTLPLFPKQLKSYESSRRIVCSQALVHGWRKKKEPGTHCLCMFSSSRISGNLKISIEYMYVTLTSLRHVDISRVKGTCNWPRSEWWWRSNEGTRLFTCRNCPCLFIPAKLHDWRNVYLRSSLLGLVWLLLLPLLAMVAAKFNYFST